MCPVKISSYCQNESEDVRLVMEGAGGGVIRTGGIQKTS
jgi:hypothetical protein